MLTALRFISAETVKLTTFKISLWSLGRRRGDHATIGSSDRLSGLNKAAGRIAR